jgi:hypothetical protein
VVAFYNGRGTAEQWIREGKNVVRLQLHALAYNLANFLRTLVLLDEVERWSLSTLREKVVKIGAMVIAHARYTVFQMAEVAVPRELFRRILDLIDKLRPRLIGTRGAVGRVQPAGAGSGGEPTSWSSSETVGRATLPPKARQRAAHLGNVGLFRKTRENQSSWGSEVCPFTRNLPRHINSAGQAFLCS